MKQILVWSPLLAVLTICSYLVATASSQSTTASQTESVVAAASSFLNSLSPEQRKMALFSFTPEKTATAAKFARTGGGRGPGGGNNGPGGTGRNPGGPGFGRAPGGDRKDSGGAPGGGPGMGPGGGFVGEQYGKAVWSNYPVSDVPRPGLTLGSLSAAQREAAMKMMQVLLSSKGYRKVLETMGSDQALSDAGTPFASGVNSYTVGIFGQPSLTSPWMLQYGGHHLALNITIAANHGVITPTMTGAQPSVYTSKAKTVRALAQENDKAFALLNALDETQRKQAILNYRIGDLVLGPGHAGETIQPEGVKASALNEHQRTLLLDVISEWAGIVNETYAAPRLADIQADLNETYFAWSGPTTHESGRNGSAYYRIQGPRVIIEFSPQGVGGDPTNHVHTVYRDPTNDYGVKFTGAK